MALALTVITGRHLLFDQPRIGDKLLRLADQYLVEARIRRVQQVVGLGRDHCAGYGEHRGE